MSSGVDVEDVPLAPWYAFDESDVTSPPSLEPDTGGRATTRDALEKALQRTDHIGSGYLYNFVASDATEIWQRIKTPSPKPSYNVVIRCSDGLDLPLLGMVHVGSSVNKSAFETVGPSQVVEEQLDQLFSSAHEEQFEVGTDSRFARSLQQLSERDPVTVLQCLRERLVGSEANSEVLGEVLRWASRLEAVAIRTLVVELISTGLHHPSSLVRDAAALSFACLDEGRAIAHLQQALGREQVPELREDLEDLIRSLERSRV